MIFNLEECGGVKSQEIMTCEIEEKKIIMKIILCSLFWGRKVKLL
jgi:hypothetical protein